MELYIVRHAIAEDGDDDDIRPLSPKGRKRFRDVVNGLMALEVRFDLVLHSPKLRAVQTAELLNPLLDGKMESTPLLAAQPSDGLLKLLTSDSPIAVVGHEPDLSALIAWLVTGDKSMGNNFEMKKGAVAHLEGAPAPGGMKLRALLPPSALRR